MVRLLVTEQVRVTVPWKDALYGMLSLFLVLSALPVVTCGCLGQADGER